MHRTQLLSLVKDTIRLVISIRILLRSQPPSRLVDSISTEPKTQQIAGQQTRSLSHNIRKHEKHTHTDTHTESERASEQASEGREGDREGGREKSQIWEADLTG